MRCNCQGCELQGLFFGNVTLSEMEEMCMRKTERVFKKGEIIIQQGSPISEFIYLKQGLVKLYITDNIQTEQIVNFAQPLDFVSLLSTFSDTRFKYSVSALEDSVTCNISLQEIIQLVEQNGKFAMDLIKKLNIATDRIIGDLLKVRQKRLAGRIAYLLVYFAESVYKHDVYNIPISRKEMAEYIGMSIENVIRTMSDFRRDKLIKINGKSIEIIDLPMLKQISEKG